jgi:hypothetical protein
LGQAGGETRADSGKIFPFCPHGGGWLAYRENQSDIVSSAMVEKDWGDSRIAPTILKLSVYPKIVPIF